MKYWAKMLIYEFFHTDYTNLINSFLQSHSTEDDIYRMKSGFLFKIFFKFTARCSLQISILKSIYVFPR